MKQIGRLENNNIMLEATELEVERLWLLSKMAKGGHWPYAGYRNERDPMNADIAEALNAVIEWVTIKDHANQLRSLADEIDRIIQQSKSQDAILVELKE